MDMKKDIQEQNKRRDVGDYISKLCKHEISLHHVKLEDQILFETMFPEIGK